MDADPDGGGDVEKLQGRDPGEDPENPYENTDISELPDWWRESIEEFRQYGLRPYRPPRFEDGELKHEVVGDLEDRHGVEVRFVAYPSGSPATGRKVWEVRVDGETVGEVDRRRSPEGYTVYGMDSGEFVEFLETKL